MNIPVLLKANVQPFFIHLLIVILTGVINIGVWGNGVQKEYSFIVLMISLCLYFLAGWFLINANPIYKNPVTVFVIPISSLLLYLGVLIPEADFFFEFLYFVTIQPFLTFTGIPADFGHPFLFAFLPSLLLWSGSLAKILVQTIFK